MSTDTELRELLAKAHPLPWDHEDEGSIGSNDEWIAHMSHHDPDRKDYGQAMASADLIVAAVNALPGLLDRAERAERERDARWVEAIEQRDRADAAEAKLAAIAALVDDWGAIRAHNGRPMLTTANVVDRLRGLLDQDGDE